MNTTCIRFRCPSCRARIKAPRVLAGRARNCPGCEQSFTVPLGQPEDAEPVLVALEGMDHYKLGTTFGLSARSLWRQTV